jgi:hypothetical protein
LDQKEVNIETDKRSLVVYYDARKDDYDEAIVNALDLHGLKEGQIIVIGYPSEDTYLGRAHA